MNVIRSQKMAQVAYPLVARLQQHELESKYRTLALNFPSMILQAGLSQSIGFLLAKGSLKKNENSNNQNEHLLLLQHLTELLGYTDSETFHKTILNADLAQYQLFTRKALDASSCLKRYTQALLKSEKDKGKANE